MTKANGQGRGYRFTVPLGLWTDPAELAAFCFHAIETHTRGQIAQMLMVLQAVPRLRASEPQPRSATRSIAPARREEPKINRSDLCPCGSGEYFDQCHGEA